MSVWVCVCVLARARWRTDLLFHTFPIGWLIGWLIHWLIGRWVDWLIEWVIAGGPHYARGQVIVNIVNGVRNWPFVLAKTKMTMWVWSKIHRCIHFTYMPWKRGQCGTSIAYAHKSFSLVPRPRLARLLETIGEGADLDFAREAGCQVAQICVLCIPWFLPLRHTFLKGVGSQQLGSPSSSCSDSWWWGLAPRCARWTVLWKMIRGMMDELGQSCIMIMLHPVVFFVEFRRFLLSNAWSIIPCSLCSLGSVFFWLLLKTLDIRIKSQERCKHPCCICRGWSTTLQSIHANSNCIQLAP